MGKRLFAIMFAVMIFAALYASAQAQSSQTIEMDVPFAFTSNNKSLPAGTYRIESASDSRVLWAIRGRNHGTAEFLLSTGLVGKASADDVRATFHRYGDKYFLVGFKTAAYEVNLPASHQEKNLMAVRTTVPAEVVNIPVGVGGSR